MTGSTTKRGVSAAAGKAMAAMLLTTTALGSSAFIATPALAQTARSYDIPAGSLADVLNQYARQASVELAYRAELTAGLSSPGLKGVYGPADGLSRVLLGTGVTFRQTGPRAFTLEPAPQKASGAIQLGPVRVEGDEGVGEADGRASLTSDPAATEGTGSYTTRSMNTATGLALSIRETPQSVSVITRQQIDDFALNTLQDIAAATPGLSLKYPDVSTQESNFYARGFAFLRLNIDGVPLSIDDGNERTIAADMVMYDRIEVVRGAAGLLQGAGEASGSVNLVRKRPTREPLLNLSVGVGSWSRLQASADASTPLDKADDFRVRVAGSWRDGDDFVDVAQHDNKALYGIFEADLGPATTLAVGGYVQRSRTTGLDTGLPAGSDGRHLGLPRSTFLGVADSFQNRDNDGLFADLTHRVGGDWTIKLAAAHVEATSDSRYTTNSRVSGSETTLRQGEAGWRYTTSQDVVDLRANGVLHLFGRTHDLVLGANYRTDENVYTQTWGGGGGRLVDIYNWDANSYALTGSPPSNPLLQQRNNEDWGIYAAGNFHLLEPLHAIVGGRLAWFKQDATGWYNGTPTWTRNLDESAKLIPYAGLVLDVDRNHSLYGSITQVFNPQNSTDFNGKTLPPLTGTNYELGVKGEYLDGALNVSAALFRMAQLNRAIRDLARCPTGGAIDCYRAAGEVRSDGVEIAISGSPAPGWQLTAGYTYVDATYRKDADTANIGKRIATDEPQHQFKLFTSYRLPGGLDKWTLSGSLVAQSKIYTEEDGFYIEQRPYAIVGLGLAFDATERLRLQLNVDNLLDETYYRSLGYSWSGSYDFYGAPRSILLTARYKF